MKKINITKVIGIVLIVVGVIFLSNNLFSQEPVEQSPLQQQVVPLADYQKIFNNFIYLSDKCITLEEDNNTLNSDNANLKLANQRVGNAIFELLELECAKEIIAIFEKNGVTIGNEPVEEEE